MNASKELCTLFDCKDKKRQCFITWFNRSIINSNHDINHFKIKVNNELQLNTGNTISTTNINGVDVKLADTSLSPSIAGIQVSTIYKQELQQ